MSMALQRIVRDVHPSSHESVSCTERSYLFAVHDQDPHTHTY